jgi:hypothetical protein
MRGFRTFSSPTRSNPTSDDCTIIKWHKTNRVSVRTCNKIRELLFQGDTIFGVPLQFFWRNNPNRGIDDLKRNTTRE